MSVTFGIDFGVCTQALQKIPGLGQNMIRLSDQSETSSDMADPCQETVMGRGGEGRDEGVAQKITVPPHPETENQNP